MSKMGLLDYFVLAKIPITLAIRFISGSIPMKKEIYRMPTPPGYRQERVIVKIEGGD
jgi:hypothetical protein